MLRRRVELTTSTRVMTRGQLAICRSATLHQRYSLSLSHSLTLSVVAAATSRADTLSPPLLTDHVFNGFENFWRKSRRLWILPNTATPLLLIRYFFTARRCASAVYVVVMCPSVCLSVTSRCCIETTRRIELVLAWRLHSTYPTLWYKDIWVSPKIRVVPSGLENFASASRSRCQQNSLSLTVEFVDDTYRTVDESWLFTAGRSTVTL